MNIVLIGPPGAGKGTISEWLKEAYQLNYLSTGDLFRGEIKKGTELGKLAKKLIDNGEYIPDELTCDIVFNYISDKDGYILDGFPRTLFQAEKFTEYNRKTNKKLDYVLYFTLDESIIKSRLSGRRVCPNCKSIFHVTNIPPNKEGVCDNCGGVIEQRKDDRQEFIQKRLDIYKESTLPVVHHYMESNESNFIELDTNGNIEEVQQKIVDILK